jgi:hypothetical protein
VGRLTRQIGSVAKDSGDIVSGFEVPLEHRYGPILIRVSQGGELGPTCHVCWAIDRQLSLAVRFRISFEKFTYNLDRIPIDHCSGEQRAVKVRIVKMNRPKIAVCQVRACQVCTHKLATK